MTDNIPLLKMEGIEKSFPGVKALKHVTFEIRSGEVHALMGENGAGKSTLMKILAGAHTADAGTLYIDGKPVTITTPQMAQKHGIGIIYQELNLIPHLSVAQNIFLGHMTEVPAKNSYSLPGFINHKAIKKEAERILSDLGVSIDVNIQVSQLPLAQQQLVEIAKAISRNIRVIAMDEPSATLTEHELDNLWTLINKLKSSGVGVIYISHRMEEVFRIADRITVLRDGQTIATHLASEVNQDTLIREMVGRNLDENFPKEFASIGKPVLEIKGLTRKKILQDVNLTVNAGEVVGLAGLVGAGRTEIARCIFGCDKYDAGEIQINGKKFHPKSPADAIHAGIGFVTEDRKGQGLVLPMSVRENMTLASLKKISLKGFISGKKERSASKDYVERLGVKTPSIEAKVQTLSGGNQQKVVLGKWLLQQPKLLILDEPTRGIDVGAKVEIYRLINALAAEGVGILFISSELPEILGMADRIVVMRSGKVAGELKRSEATQENVGALAIAG